jgi:histidine ammonia-lyase
LNVETEYWNKSVRKILSIGERTLTIEEVVHAACNDVEIKISQAAADRVADSRQSVERVIASGAPVYGVNTGVGKLAHVRLPEEQLEVMQHNLLLSHSAGVGENLDIPTVRCAMLLRAASLLKGYSGIRFETILLLVELLNKGITPLVPSKGSVGSSGDLAPLAHIALALTGTGNCDVKGSRMPAALALRLNDLEPITPGAKEALALINGTQIMTASLALTTHHCRRLVRIADVAGAMSLEAVHGMPSAFEERLHALRPHRGQGTSAANIRRLVKDSALVGSEPERVQDAYSLRCMPVVHGTSRDALDYVSRVVEIEMNSVTDNPAIFPEDDSVISGGNFHGQPLAIAADLLGIACAELGNISERRTNRLLDGSYSHLPLFLVREPGTNSGLMIPQYTAAALVSENKGLAFPNSVDSITTSAHQEDHNSMGTISVRNAESILTNVETIYAIELMVAAQALEFSEDANPGIGVRAAWQAIREVIPAWEEDRYLYTDLKAMQEYTRTGDLLERARAACGVID